MQRQTQSKTQRNNEMAHSPSLAVAACLTIPQHRKKDMSEQEGFERLLGWLDSDRELAGERYERTRRKLIVFFAARGKDQPEKMADDCIDVVIRKLPEIIAEYRGSPEPYFWGVAKMMIKKPDPNVVSIDYFDPPDDPPPPDIERRHGCLEQCLGRISPANRELILEFYRLQGKAKIEHRAFLARQLGIAANALRIRAHRIRRALETCMKECLENAELGT
jgi:DNA-directed RNA polymerase specialized sigma24 family protein